MKRPRELKARFLRMMSVAVKRPKELNRRLLKRVGMGLLVATVTMAVLLPIYMGTQTYPIAIVEGNSMYPTLQNGDLIVFHSPSQGMIANDSIIVFVQTGTGISALDSLMKPVLVHRIVGVVVQSDGMVNYQTKGDNNQQVDPALVPASRVLGTPETVIPKAGLIIMFVQSPQGLIAIVGVITFIFIGKSEDKMKKEEEKRAFLGVLAQMSLNNELSEAVFRKFQLAVEYVEDLKFDELKDGRILTLVDWIRNGGLDNKWMVMKIECPKCSSTAANFYGANGLLLVICPTCNRADTHG
ncbi:MAG TPA: signal peptidase I [Nitrososphaerales archaeon]|nr:signal peptidase I [Nitrososphaerales archaeon]